MSGCCFYCEHAANYWVDREGNKRRPPDTSFADMNLFCQHPQKRGCYRISYSQCSHFKRIEDEKRIQRRRDFFAQFEGFRLQAMLIGQRP